MARKVIYPPGTGPLGANKKKRPAFNALGSRTFEVIVYNQRVREAVERGEHHAQYDDQWSENRYVEVEAETPEIARRKISTRYPKHHGFVIVDVIDTISKFDEEM
ncbi:MAG: hypothetical protein RID42_13100 [Alphaproteobacteria bacterium]